MSTPEERAAEIRARYHEALRCADTVWRSETDGVLNRDRLVYLQEQYIVALFSDLLSTHAQRLEELESERAGWEETAARFCELLEEARAERDAWRGLADAGAKCRDLLQVRTYGPAPVLGQPRIPSVDKALNEYNAAYDVLARLSPPPAP
jgi:hypothetical protein